MDTLQKKNPHERDTHITFDEEPHIYTIDGDSNYMSVTTWNHKHFEQFDADKIIGRMMKSKNWSNSKYYRQTPDEIKEGWEKNRDEAATAGTKLHYDIETYYNNCPVDNTSVEYKYFINFVEMTKHFAPYRTEWMIWDKELRFAGSIDMVYENTDGTLLIYDWKRSKGIEKTTRYNKYSHTECISHLPDTNFWHYSLQLNTYKAIIEKNYGKIVSGMMLVCLYPDNKDYQLFKVPNLQDEINELFKLRKSMLINT
jgi:ATP-dependent exoDNAse (exonuclease V) beta subunit